MRRTLDVSDQSNGSQGQLFSDAAVGAPRYDEVDTDAVGYRGPTACSAAGITYRQLDYWARTGFVAPSARPPRQPAVRELANVTLLSDGATVYECPSAEEVVDLLAGGQGVFGIAVS